MKIEVKKTITIKPGKHNGMITSTRYREKPYNYIDLIIEMNVEDEIVRLNAGYAMALTKKSMLGKAMMRFGTKLEPGKSIDPDDVFIGQLCNFITYDEETNNGTFAKIDPTTVEPINGTQTEITEETTTQPNVQH